MLLDSQYLSKRFRLSELEHHYGPNIHVLSDPYLFSMLSQLCRLDCHQPLINQLLNTLYRELVKSVVNQEFPLTETTIETRMAPLHPEATFRALAIDRQSSVVCVNLARAGTVPSQICFDAFNYILNPINVRQDHIAINRKVDDKDRVIGTHLAGVKIGGRIDGAFLVFPDPMGATGSTIKTAVEIYRQQGIPKKIIAIHLIITPEYIQNVTAQCPEVTVYAIRLDRGLSTPDSLKELPGKHKTQERGLNEKHYIVPGAGGLGEVINNANV